MTRRPSSRPTSGRDVTATGTSSSRWPDDRSDRRGGRCDPPRADPRGPRRDLRGDGGERHPDLAFGDRQERDGLLDRAVRRERPDHRPGRDPAQPARSAARRGRRCAARVRRHPGAGRRGHGQRPIRRRHAPARHLRGQAGLPRRAPRRDRGDRRAPRRPRRDGAREHVALRRGVLPGGAADPATAALCGWCARARRLRPAPGQHAGARHRARRHGGAARRLRHGRDGAAAAHRPPRRGRLHRPGRAAARLHRGADPPGDPDAFRKAPTDSPTISTTTASTQVRSRSRSR